MSKIHREQLEEGVTLLRLNRPERLNAIDFDVVAELHAVLDEISSDRDCRVVILTGEGRAFCAGTDLKGPGVAPGTDGLGRPQTGMKAQEFIVGLIPHMRAVPQPIIAAINGAATGGGLALALGSDIRIASQTARFGVAAVRIGLSGCDVGMSYLLPRAVGTSHAFELMLSGRVIDAAEAERIGLVSRVVAPASLIDAALETARTIRGNSPFGVWMTKEVMWANLEAQGLTAAIDRENRTQVLALMTNDMSEAVAAFLTKRPPDFTNT